MLSMIKKDDDGAWKLSEVGERTNPEVSSMVIRSYNGKMVTLAEQSVDRFPPNERDVSGMTLALSEKMIQKMKIRIQEFKEKILADILCDESEADYIYQMNFQLFPVVLGDNNL